MSGKPQATNKQYRDAIKEAAFYKKQASAYAAAIVALADDSTQLKELVAIGTKGTLLAKKYEDALKQIRDLLADRQAFVMMGMRSFAAVQNIVDEALPKERHCNNGLQCLMGEDCPIKSCVCICGGCRP
jgi:hypothetical protein